jgi:hypothetical protein
MKLYHYALTDNDIIAGRMFKLKNRRIKNWHVVAVWRIKFKNNV